MREPASPQTLLHWYDRHARVLPWRIPPGNSGRSTLPDPYRIWLSEVMLQQTTVAAVAGYFRRFLHRWPDVKALAAAEDGVVMAEWAGLGYYARARNLLKCARLVVSEHGGVFPQRREELLRLPGIGPYTAAAIAAIAHDQCETVVDGNVERVMARLFDIHTPLPAAKAELTARAASLTPTLRCGDYAQAVMDLGATICTPRSPSCGICPWQPSCLAYAQGTAADLPRKLRKAPKPTRFGMVYIARRADGAWLLERRPDKGLLAGMLGWPGAPWGETALADPPLATTWQPLAGEVRHTFTHFHLRLSISVAVVPQHTRPHRGSFLPAADFDPSDLPTVMRKAFNLALTAFDNDDFATGDAQSPQQRSVS